MLNLPKGIIHVLRRFEGIFSERVWEWAKVLLIGAILAPGERTVTAILRVMGLHQERLSPFPNSLAQCFFKAAQHPYNPLRQIEHLSSLFVIRFERSLLCLSFFV